jgi:hypothetical protein
MKHANVGQNGKRICGMGQIFSAYKKKMDGKQRDKKQSMVLIESDHRFKKIILFLFDQLIKKHLPVKINMCMEAKH